MTLDETLDFDMDPRGVIPDAILARTWGMVSEQMKFVIGHEFAHHRLGHLAEGAIPYRAARSPSLSSVERGWLAAKRSWEHEYEADLGALEALTDPSKKLHITIGAIQFFLCLIFFEEVFEGLDAGLKEVDTHPPTEERLRRIVFKFGYFAVCVGGLVSVHLPVAQDVVR
ncbi:M48 family metalloprotease [Roseinatronobacter monicus]|nr:M48 family metalloprotease [Roseinatronobacter monicus]